MNSTIWRTMDAAPVVNAPTSLFQFLTGSVGVGVTAAVAVAVVVAVDFNLLHHNNQVYLSGGRTR